MAKKVVEDKRQAILDSALSLFADQGFHGTSVPQIAQKAGVAAGTIYRYFDGKEAMVNVLYRHWRETVQLFGHPKDFVPDTYRHYAIMQQLHAWDNAYVPDPAGAPIMTDDRTPIDLWAERINWEARKDLHDYFGKDGTSW